MLDAVKRDSECEYLRDSNARQGTEIANYNSVARELILKAKNCMALARSARMAPPDCGYLPGSMQLPIAVSTLFVPL